MKRTCIAMLLSLAVLFLPAYGSGTIYKWVSEDGVVTFKDTPPPAGVNAKIITPQDTVLGDGYSPPPVTDVQPSVTKGKTEKRFPKVEIYMAKWCPTCKIAIKYLDSIGVKYIKYDIDEDKAANERLSRQYGQRAIPFTIIGQEKILGFSRPRFDAALGISK